MPCVPACLSVPTRLLRSLFALVPPTFQNTGRRLRLPWVKEVSLGKGLLEFSGRAVGVVLDRWFPTDSYCKESVQARENESCGHTMHAQPRRLRIAHLPRHHHILGDRSSGCTATWACLGGMFVRMVVSIDATARHGGQRRTQPCVRQPASCPGFDCLDCHGCCPSDISAPWHAYRRRCKGPSPTTNSA